MATETFVTCDAPGCTEAAREDDERWLRVSAAWSRGSDESIAEIELDVCSVAHVGPALMAAIEAES